MTESTFQINGAVEVDTPIFSSDGVRGTALIGMAHYSAMKAVVDAARTGNNDLIALALDALDTTSKSSKAGY